MVPAKLGPPGKMAVKPGERVNLPNLRTAKAKLKGLIRNTNYNYGQRSDVIAKVDTIRQLDPV